MIENDVQLIHSVLSGDEQAFSTLVQKYQKSVHALAWRKIGDFHIAEEITQDAFLQAYKNLARLRNPCQFAGWLYVIANRLCLKWLQKRRTPMQSLETMPVPEAEKSAYKRYVSEQREQEAAERRHEIVKELLEKLPESERTVMTLYYLGEMTTTEISKFLGVSVNTIKSRLRRARERLQAEEHLIGETLGSVQLPANLIEKVMQQVADIKPASPSAGKPLLPWVAFGTAAILILLMLGIGSEYLARFQRPYNLNAESETTVEIIEAPVVLDTQAEPDVRNQAGSFDTTGRSSGAGPQTSEPVLPAAAQIEKQEVLTTPQQQWIQAGGPEGSLIRGLFVGSEGDIYAASRHSLYRLAPDAPAWTFISPAAALNLSTTFEGPDMIRMAEQNGTLYLASTNEVFISTDRGEMWESLGARPDGFPVGLAITDEALYLALQTNGIFRSVDEGKQWTRVDDEATERQTNAVATLENTVFVGTTDGLYRINPSSHSETSGIWEKLPLTSTKAIQSLATAEDTLYVGTGPDLGSSKLENSREEIREEMSAGRALWEIFRSTDFGDSWTEITPASSRTSLDEMTPEAFLMKMSPGIKVVAAGKTLWALGYTGSVVRSTDGGETWTNPGPKTLDVVAMMNSFMLSVFPTVGMDENTLFKASLWGLTRSTDGGASWHPFMTGMVGTRISDLVAFENALYAYTGTNIAKSTDGGMSWQTLSFNPLVWELHPNFLFGFSRLAVSEDKLYGIARSINVPSDQHYIFHLSAKGDALEVIQETPILDEDISIQPPKPELQAVPEKSIADDPPNAPVTNFPQSLAVSGETFYVAYKRQLFRWTRGEPEWFNTGLIDTDKPVGDDSSVRFALAVSGETVYVGKRDGHLFRSLDRGNTWKDLTATLPLRFNHFRDIIFAGPAVYVATDAGVLTSQDGENWRAITDTVGSRTVIDRIVAHGTTVYGAGDTGAYQLDNRGRWKQILPESPSEVISVVINGNTLYIATKRSGMFHASLQEE